MLIDITRLVHPHMAIYPNNPLVAFELVQEAVPGEKNALSRVTLGTHTGTHIDSPRHIQSHGAGTAVYTLDQLCGFSDVVDLSQLPTVISGPDIPVTATTRIIFKTKNSLANPDEFRDDFVALDDSAAEEIVRRGVKLVGLDALSIRKRGTKNRVHEILLDAGIIIVEGLWLANVEAGKYELICLPIKWDLDGAPARVVLRT